MAMMASSMTPQRLRRNSDDVYALLGLVTDPARRQEYDALLKTLVDAVEEADAIRAETREMRAAAEQAQGLADAADANATNKLREAREMTANALAIGEVLEAQKREQALEAAELKEREAFIAKREDDYARRERALVEEVGDKRAAAEKIARQAKSVKDEYEQKIAALRAIVEPPMPAHDGRTLT